MYSIIVYITIAIFTITTSLEGTKLNYTKTNVYVINEKGTNLFVCDIADTPEKWQTGLMFRKNLKSNEGMIFIFPFPQYLSFWMKNTYLPLAIIFIKEDKTVSDIFFPQPLSTIPVNSSTKCKYVLEILSNVGKDLNIKKGDKILF